MQKGRLLTSLVTYPLTYSVIGTTGAGLSSYVILIDSTLDQQRHLHVVTLTLCIGSCFVLCFCIGQRAQKVKSILKTLHWLL